jgi:hypothetical protein
MERTNNIEERRNKAGEYIIKHGIFSSPHLRYITRPLYGYVHFKNIGYLKELGVKYRFIPINEVNFTGHIKRTLDKKLKMSDVISFINVTGMGKRIEVFFEYGLTKDEILPIKDEITKILDEINVTTYTSFFISKIDATKSKESIRKSVQSKLNDESPRESEYDKITIFLDIHNDDEYLAQIPMDEIDKPEMF